MPEIKQMELVEGIRVDDMIYLNGVWYKLVAAPEVKKEDSL